ncbi:GNAT family N-acetyltransferase [Salmonirosea aquatica]|uniref:GNAT family N-acetyltransferase n=1 Tax=Salmonirosea aquatica TaxID=2654236 RepID=A0A7C9FNY1_9BACT|nr:GNAT family N-acetyltransferase [Cytophagaceae bacterium SJW1-29]
MSETKYEIVRLKGAEIASVFDELAALRIAVFRGYPYLYEGNVAYEKDYLQIYSRSERSFMAALYLRDKMVGATTCLPLDEETDELKKPFRENGLDPATYFYFGESIILQPHRGQGFGHLFFDEREAHAKSFGTHTHTCFCAVDRGTSHPLMPSNYRSNDDFWLKRGYQKMPSLQTTMEWPDVGEEISTPKPMVFWVRKIPK